MTRKLKRWMIVLLTLAAISAVGVTLAFMFKRTNTVNTFVPAQVSCTVHERLDGAEVTDLSAVGSEKSDIRVQNTGNVQAYLRVRLVSYFVDEDKNITGEIPSAYPKLTLNDGWLPGESNTYYYTKPVEPNGSTPVLCEPFPLLEQAAQDGKTVYQVVEVLAEAIQAEPVAAVEGAWGVTVAEDGALRPAA